MTEEYGNYLTRHQPVDSLRDPTDVARVEGFLYLVGPSLSIIAEFNIEDFCK